MTRQLETLRHVPLFRNLTDDEAHLLDRRANEFISLDVRRRILVELVRLSRPDRADRTRGVVSPPPFHTEIAARVLARREAVTRELNLLERVGLLERRRGAFILTDVEALLTQIRNAEIGGIGAPHSPFVPTGWLCGCEKARRHQACQPSLTSTQPPPRPGR